MPVFPLVASTTVVLPGSISPSSLANSSTSAASGAIRVSRTTGVPPTWSAMLAGTRGMACAFFPTGKGAGRASSPRPAPRPSAVRVLRLPLPVGRLERRVGRCLLRAWRQQAGRKPVGAAVDEQVLDQLLDAMGVAGDRVRLLDVGGALALGDRVRTLAGVAELGQVEAARAFKPAA